jgi:hypothetical protein
MRVDTDTCSHLGDQSAEVTLVLPLLVALRFWLVTTLVMAPSALISPSS